MGSYGLDYFMRFIAILVILLAGQELKSQTYSSRNNYTGSWEDPATWSYFWANPTGSVNGADLNINGYVYLNGSLTIRGTGCTITVYDTLVVYGDLSLGNNTNLVVANNGVLIISGNLIVVNNTDIFTDGYVIVTGDFINTSTTYDGSFWTTGNPARVFFSGLVPNIDDDHYQVLDCDSLFLTPYSHSGCAYGNTTDLMEDPVFSFFESVCRAVTSSGSNSPLCEGQTLILNATGGSHYLWSGPGGFSSDEQNPEIPEVSSANKGSYIIRVNSKGCIITDTVEVIINNKPLIDLTVNRPLCEGETIIFSISAADRYMWTGPSGFLSSEQNPVINSAGPIHNGVYVVRSFTSDGCSDSASVTIAVTSMPEAFAGEDIMLENEYQTFLNANKGGYEIGKWSAVSGSGIFSDENSPESLLSGLTEGVSIFKWTTANGACQVSDEIRIRVIPLFIPNVITPNSDGKNDNLIISALGENAELIIFNRMGITVYSTDNYLNNWNGVDSSGNELQDDTYYYVLKTGNGLIRKGSILIKRR